MLSDKLSSALDLFKTKSPSLIGVDIASTSIKMIEFAVDELADKLDRQVLRHKDKLQEHHHDSAKRTLQ